MAYEQAVEKASFQTRKVTVIAAGHGVQDTYQAFLPALLPILIEKFSLIKTEAGLLSVFANAPSLLQPFIGYLADHYAEAWVKEGRLRALKPASRHYDLSLAAVTRKGRRPNLVLESFLAALAATR